MYIANKNDYEKLRCPFFPPLKPNSHLKKTVFATKKRPPAALGRSYPSPAGSPAAHTQQHGCTVHILSSSDDLGLPARDRGPYTTWEFNTEYRTISAQREEHVHVPREEEGGEAPLNLQPALGLSVHHILGVSPSSLSTLFKPLSRATAPQGCSRLLEFRPEMCPLPDEFSRTSAVWGSGFALRLDPCLPPCVCRSSRMAEMSLLRRLSLSARPTVKNWHMPLRDRGPLLLPVCLDRTCRIIVLVWITFPMGMLDFLSFNILYCSALALFVFIFKMFLFENLKSHMVHCCFYWTWLACTHTLIP